MPIVRSPIPPNRESVNSLFYKPAPLPVEKVRRLSGRVSVRTIDRDIDELSDDDCRKMLVRVQRAFMKASERSKPKLKNRLEILTRRLC